MRAGRRLAISAVCLAAASPALALGPAEMKDRTAVIAERYLEIWSSNNATPITGVPYMYGPTVTFYGRTYTRGQLVAEKRDAIRAWPIRRYVHRPGTLRVVCNVPERKCAARSIIDFTASNPERGTAKRGSAKFDLGISFADSHPRILYEGGSLNGKRG